MSPLPSARARRSEELLFDIDFDVDVEFEEPKISPAAQRLRPHQRHSTWSAEGGVKAAILRWLEERC